MMRATRFALALATLVLLPSAELGSLPDDDIISKWSDELERKISELVGSATGLETAKRGYQPDPNVILDEISGEEILESMLRDMTVLLDKKRQALQRLVDTAERNVIYTDQSLTTMLTLEDVPFFNVKMPPPKNETPFNERFRQRVSLEQSGVHIPLEVFDGWMGPRYKENWWHGTWHDRSSSRTFADAKMLINKGRTDQLKTVLEAAFGLFDPQLLNGLNWSRTLDDVFKENFEQDPTISWQFFGSTFGFMRVFPAFRWPDHPPLPDLFDVRRRSWYIEGAASPKDVIILIDRSGSVHGQTLDIMKITVRALLNSLGENDYVNVAWFNNEVRWVIPCMNTLVQATAQNRRLMSDAVERLTESNFTSYAAALAFAFDAFKKFDEARRPWGGSNCHKAIMFLSDGGTDWPEELVTQHCNQSRTGHIKLFTFACGPHPIPTVVLKEMACATGGFFSPITALGSVRIKIQDYVRVLSRPLAFAATPNLFHWHNFYRDIGGLGMMTTVTLPVYSRKPGESTGSDRLLGVMGIDIPIEEMKKVYPKHQLGPFGYGFSINLNGFVVFHPRLLDHIVYIEDPPDVDLADLEGHSEDVSRMRREMVDGVMGKLENYACLIPAGLGHAITVHMNYFFGAVNGSDFRFGVALPTGELKMKFRSHHHAQDPDVLTSLDGLHVAPWGICTHVSSDDELTPMELADRIKANFSHCEPNKVSHLLFDATRASEIQSAWRKAAAEGVYTRFLMTSGGLSLLQPAEAVYGTNRQLDPFRSVLYKWAARTARCILSVSRGRSYDVTAACRILYQGSYVAAVIGVEMERSLVQEIVHDLPPGPKSQPNCGDPHSLMCYVLNDGGAVIATNQRDVRGGTFIGELDPQILKFLMERNILGSERRFNYHSWCSKQTYQVQPAASKSVSTVTHALLNAFMSLDLTFLYDYIALILTSFAISVGATKEKYNASNDSCVTSSAWYYLNNDLNCEEDDEICLLKARQLLSGSIYCPAVDGPCQRDIRARFLPNVTAIFVVAAPKCPCANSIPFEHIDPQDVGPDHCDIRQPYRKRPMGCFVEMPEGNETDCGAGPPSSSTITFRPLLDFLVMYVTSVAIAVF